MSDLTDERVVLITAWSASIHEERDRITEEAIAKLSPREQRLVREAAVMGYVQGRMAFHKHDDPHPKDTVVYRQVVCECAKDRDHFPFIAGVEGTGGTR